MNTFRTFKRTARNWEELARARKHIVDRGLSYEEARRKCREYNEARNAQQIRLGTKMEFEAED